MRLVLTCEHGGHYIPNEYIHLFSDTSVLETHRGFDIGALDMFNHLKPLATVSKFSETSRLLIELNRSLHHRNLFSEYSKSLSKSEKKGLISNYYQVYRNEVEASISALIQSRQTVLHLSVHSFTPNLDGLERQNDIGLLYDSSMPKEKAYCKQLRNRLLQMDNLLNIRFNYPYLGKADGFTTYLRKVFPNRYLGIELEINQKHSKHNTMNSKIKNDLYSAIQSTIN